MFRQAITGDILKQPSHFIDLIDGDTFLKLEQQP
jgi:hypothetical protein